jgi:wyosine [tRNA(Phe)-imidazoG37] synthetase (radical SAM superfamily)
MLAQGINDSEESLQLLAEVLRTIRADSIDINTPVRPVPARSVYPCSESSLQAAKNLFGPKAEIIASYVNKKTGASAHTFGEESAIQKILEMLSRRPCTADDIHCALGMDPKEITRLLEKAMSTGRIKTRQHSGSTYFFVRAITVEKDGT